MLASPELGQGLLATFSLLRQILTASFCVLAKGVYVSDQADKTGRAMSKRRYEHSRINIADAVEEWEAQNNVC